MSKTSTSVSSYVLLIIHPRGHRDTLFSCHYSAPHILPAVQPPCASSQGELPLARQVVLLHDLSVVHFSRDEIIFATGESSSALYFIIKPPEATATISQEKTEGSDRATAITSGGTGAGKKELLQTIVPAGGYFGESGLIYRCVVNSSGTMVL